MKLLLLLLVAFSRGFIPYARGSPLSGELFRAVFQGNAGLAGNERNVTLQEEKHLPSDQTRHTLVFTPGENCHSILTEDFGEFFLPASENNQANFWCNWVIWAGPRRLLIVNITGFITSEDCAENQDAIIFHGIASSTEGTVVYACWNKNIHVFSTRAVAVHVIYMAQNSSQKHAGTYFHGKYYIFDDYETILLKYPLFSSLFAKEFVQRENREGSKIPRVDPLQSANSSTEQMSSYTHNPNMTLRQTFLKTTFFGSTLLSNNSKSSKHPKGVLHFTTASELYQIPNKKATPLSVDGDDSIQIEVSSKSSGTPRRHIFMITKPEEASVVTVDGQIGLGKYVDDATLSLESYSNDVEQPIKSFDKAITSLTLGGENEFIQSELAQQESRAVQTDHTQSILMYRTTLHKLHQAIHKNQPNISLKLETMKNNVIPGTPHQALGVFSSQAFTPYLEASLTTTREKWFRTKVPSFEDRDHVSKHVNQQNSTTPDNMLREHYLIFPSRAPLPPMITTKTQQKPFTHQEGLISEQGFPHVKSLADGIKITLQDQHSSPSTSAHSMTKIVYFVKNRKNRRKNTLLKNKQKNKRKHLERGDGKNESGPVFLGVHKDIAKVTHPVRVVKALKSHTSAAEQVTIKANSQMPPRPPPLKETMQKLNGLSSDVNYKMDEVLEGTQINPSTFSPNLTTLGEEFEEEPFGTLAVELALGNRTALENRHNPGDILFAFVIAIEYRGTLQKRGNGQEPVLLRSIKEKIEELLMYPTRYLNEIKLQHVQRTASTHAALTFWIHLKPGGPNLDFLTSQLKRLNGVSFSNGKYVPVSLSIEDINECESEFQVCDEQADCFNEMGTYACHCKNGYEDHAETLGTACARIEPSAFSLVFIHLEILVGTSLGIVLLLVLAIVICASLKKRQVKRTLSLGGRQPSSATDSPALLEAAGPSFAQESVDSECKAHKLFPVAKLAPAGHDTSKRLSTTITRVTLEQSACL
ncbi:uncharacterized protein [Ambystoma mexicanum]|uniref:uncharacterized protein n=1 Tax=Ambystoma mexicanum TaxID=8296 RepID=UPI0037E7DE85